MVGTMRRRRGMSLVEVMVTIAIILTLMSVVALGVFQNYQWARVDLTKLTMDRAAQQVDVYEVRHGRPPTTAEGLRAATMAPEPPADGWGRPLDYASPGGQARYEIGSLAADGAPGGTGWNEDLVFRPDQR